jgi:hypothetical protein
MMTEYHTARPQQVGLASHKLGQAALNGLAVNIAATRRRQYGYVRPEVTQDAAPVPTGVLVQ